MLMDGWRHGPDPTYILSIQTCGTLPKDDGSGGNTDSFHCDPTFDRLFARQLTTFDPEKRQGIVDRMQEILYEDNNNIMLYNANLLNAVRTDIVSDLVAGSADENGLYPPQPVFWNYLEATPPAATDDGGSSNTAMYVGGGVVAVLVIVGGGIALRRRSTADERE
ncbi:MAG: ABC transporter substrate-binding protein, partial [Nocardioidaceae bacterium]